MNSKAFLEMLKASGVREIFLPVRRGKAETKDSENRASLLRLRESVLRCVKCEELAATRKSVVFGSGNPEAKLMFVGEAPGAEEDRQGLPFVGAAGQLLTKMIEAIGYRREDVFVANVLKCRPPGNRTPRPAEIESCRPFLQAQIASIRPKVICALGTFAAQTLLRTSTPISSLRGRTHPYEGTGVICTFHPAYLLRNPSEKRRAWEDLKKVKALLDSDGGA